MIKGLLLIFLGIILGVIFTVIFMVAAVISIQKDRDDEPTKEEWRAGL